jgi:hypothetical protein
MRGNDFNSYAATFKYLVKQAGFALTADATIHLFALGLNPKLQTAIIAQDHEPTTMDDWITAIQTEMCKAAKLQTFNQPGAKKYAWVQAPQPHHREHNGHGHRHHPNDESVPMDTDIILIMNQSLWTSIPLSSRRLDTLGLMMTYSALN